MKNANLYLILSFAAIVMIITTSGIFYSGGSPGGKTGSPGDVSNCTQCHSGTPVTNSGWITSNIPPAGYTAGSTYNITVTATQTGITKFGFECTAEDAFGLKVGTLGILMGAQTQLANNNKSVTHKSAGTTGSGSKSWTFSWTAPAASTGTVTFYAACNTANGNGNNSGDVIHLTNMVVPVAPINTAPFFVSTPVIEATADQAYLYSIQTNDGEGTSNLVITCPVKPSWLTFADAGNGVASLTGTPLSANLGSHSVQLQVSDGTAPAVSQSFSITVVPGSQTQNISLAQGWGMFSTYIAPVDSLFPTVFAQIVDSLAIVKDGDGSVYWPQFGVNAIGSMIIGKGYQIKMIDAQTLAVSGTAVAPESTPISINQGWGIIGYLRQTATSAVTMMSPIVANIDIMKNGAGQVYWPQFGVNAIGDMMPGQGYQIKLSSAQVLTYPAN